MFKLIRGFFRSLLGLIKEEEFQLIFSFVVLTLVLGTAVYSKVEGWSLFDSLYFSVISLTTVGYGDLYPKTVLGKAFTMIYLVVGIGILLGFVDLVANHSIKQHDEVTKRFKNGKGARAFLSGGREIGRRFGRLSGLKHRKP